MADLANRTVLLLTTLEGAVASVQRMCGAESELEALEVAGSDRDLGTVAAVLAIHYPDDWLVWRAGPVVDSAAVTVDDVVALAGKPRHRNELWHRGLDPATHRAIRTLGYVELDDAALVGAAHKHATWLLSSRLGVAHVSLFAAVRWGLKQASVESSWIDFGRRVSRAGVLCIADPDLKLGGAVAGTGREQIDLVMIIERCYGPRWVVFWRFAGTLFGPSRLANALGLVSSLWRLFGQAKAERGRFQGDVPTPVARCSRLTCDLGTVEPAPRRVSVIVPTLGREESLLALLRDLEQQRPQISETIVIEQSPEGMSDYSIDWGAVGTPVVHQRVEWIGAGRARNLGLSLASGDWILFLDDDVGLPANFVESLVSEAESWDAGAISATVVSPRTSPSGAQPRPDPMDAAERPRAIVLELAESDAERRRERHGDLTWAWTGLAGGASLVKAAAATQVNGFDERLDFGYGEDFEIGVRLRLAGHSVMTTNRVSLVHYHAPIGGFRALTGLDWNGEAEPKPSPYVLLSRSGLSQEMQRSYWLIYLLRGLVSDGWRRPWRMIRTFRLLRSAQRWKRTFSLKERGGIGARR